MTQRTNERRGRLVNVRDVKQTEPFKFLPFIKHNLSAYIKNDELRHTRCTLVSESGQIIAYSESWASARGI